MPTVREFLDEFVPAKDLIFFFDFKHTDAVVPLMEVSITQQPQQITHIGLTLTFVVGDREGGVARESDIGCGVSRSEPVCA